MPHDQGVSKSFEKDGRKKLELEHNKIRVIFYASFSLGNPIKTKA